MRLGLLVAVVLGALTVGAGCASTETPLVVDPSSDPAWLPPGQGDLEVADAPIIEEKPKAKPRPRHLQEPNHREMDRRLIVNTAANRP
ncbi:MAG: hypothetical protein KF850_06970 [Labilithrix sp.]|nr:hypothetical protein [Labilithrix sp.]